MVECVITSLQVAELFGKNHKNVLAAIRFLIRKLQTVDGEDFATSSFELTEYEDAQGKKRPAYNLTRDSYTLLAMSFTGKKAKAVILENFDSFTINYNRRVTHAQGS